MALDPGGVLDLSEQEPAPRKVKLADGQLHDMANPASLGLLPMQRLVSRYRRSQELMAKTDATEEDVEEMLSLLLDVCEVVLPSAPRDVLGDLDWPKLNRLVEAFFDASPVSATAGEADPEAPAEAAGDSKTPASS